MLKKESTFTHMITVLLKAYNIMFINILFEVSSTSDMISGYCDFGILVLITLKILIYQEPNLKLQHGSQ